jgi:hypothetical protein
MERRDLLKGGLLLGAGLLVDEPAGARPARPVPTTFFEGELGDAFTGWVVQLVASGRRVAGLAYDPASVDRNTPEGEFEPLRGVRLKGKLSRTGLKLKAYDIEDLRLRRRVGVVSAKVLSGTLQGGLRLKDRRRGPLLASQVVIAKESLALVGQYRGSIVDPGQRTLYTGLLTLAADLTWELRDIVPAGGFPALTGGTRLTGRWGVKADGSAVLSVTQVPVPAASQQSDPQHEVPRPRGKRERRPTRPLGSPHLVFQDGELHDADWTALEIVEQPSVPGDQFTAGRVEQGGNPGAFREVTHSAGSLPPSSRASSRPAGPHTVYQVAHVRPGWFLDRTQAHDPRIADLLFRFDWKPLAEAPPAIHGLVIHTPPGGLPGYYHAGVAPSPAPSGWRTDESRVQPHALRRIAGTGPDWLDAGALGRYEFGFYTFSTYQGSVGIDNVRVEVTLDTKEPPPPPVYSLELSGPTQVYTTESTEDPTLEFTAAARNGDAPVPAVPITFSTLGGPHENTTTDENGRARYRIAPHAPGTTIVARASMPDGTMASASRSVSVEPAEGICVLLCLPFGVLGRRLVEKAQPATHGDGGFCAEHPLLPGHFLCAEPLP